MQDRETEIVRRGDSFDIGEYDTPAQLPDLLANPDKLISALSLNPSQAENVRSVLTATGAGISHKMLSQHFGDEIAGAIGGFLGGFLAKKFVRR